MSYMAYITKHPKSKFWTAVYRDDEGKWVRQSTKLTGKGEARKAADDFEKANRLAREGRACVAVFRDMCDELLKKIGAGTMAQKSVRVFTAEWLRGKAVDTADGTLRRYEGTARRLLELLERKADLSISAIEPGDIGEVFDKLKALGLAPSSLSVERATIGNLFNSAKEMNLIRESPVRIKLARHIQRGQVKRLVFTPTQVQMLLDKANAEWKVAILVGYYCGLRLGDAVNLVWDNVDFGKSQLQFTQHKTGDKLEIPLHSSLLAHLSAIAKDDTGLLCPKLATAYSSGNGSVSRDLMALMREAGISSEKVRTAGKSMLSRLSFHALRKSFNSALANAGVDQELRMSMTGHQDKVVNATYTQLEHEGKAKAISLLPALKA
jgi:integrase